MIKLSWKYRYFKKKVRGVESMILDTEFKRYKMRELREERRELFDNIKSRIMSIEELAKTERAKKDDDPTKMPEGDVARKDDEVVRLGVQRDKALEEIKTLDLQLDGAKPSVDYPDGVQGFDEKLEALRELKGMLNSYIRKNL